MSPAEWAVAVDKWRTQRRYSKADFARHIDRPVETVRRWFSRTNPRTPGRQERDRVAEFLGLYTVSQRYSSNEPIDILHLEWSALKLQYCWAVATAPEHALTWLAALALKLHAVLCRNNIPVELLMSSSQQPVLFCSDFRGYKAVLELYPRSGSVGARYGLELPDRPAELHSDIEVDNQLATDFTKYCHEHLQFYNTTGESETADRPASGTGAPKMVERRSRNKRFSGDGFANRPPDAYDDSVRNLFHAGA